MGREEFYLKKISERFHDTIQLVEPYHGVSIKTAHRCLVCNTVWSKTPRKVLSLSIPCDVCREKIKYDNLKERFIEQAIKKHGPSLYLYDNVKYKNQNTKVEIFCNKHKIIFWQRPVLHIKHTGCRECKREGARKTHDEYESQVHSLTSGRLVVKGRYRGDDVPILHYCTLHNKLTSVKPGQIIRGGHGCNVCSSDRSRFIKTKDEYVLQLRERSPTVIALEEYRKDSEHILHGCTVCGNSWASTPSNMLNNGGCPECGKRRGAAKQMKSHEMYISEVESVHQGRLSVAGVYKGARTRIDHRCNVCKYIFCSMPTNILKEKGCPRCKLSKGERKIAKWLDEKSIEYIPQKTFDACAFTRPLKFDFYLPEENMCLEYHGIQHYEPVPFFGGVDQHIKQAESDEYKEMWCFQNNIRYEYLSYLEYDKVEEILTQILGVK